MEHDCENLLSITFMWTNYCASLVACHCPVASMWYTGIIQRHSYRHKKFPSHTWTSLKAHQCSLPKHLGTTAIMIKAILNITSVPLGKQRQYVYSRAVVTFRFMYHYCRTLTNNLSYDINVVLKHCLDLVF